MQAKKSKKVDPNMATCKFCGKEFKQEKTLAAHLCPKKKRFAEKDTIGARLGFRVYQKFYELTMRTTKPKSVEDFIDSQYYMDFVKFGRYLVDRNPINADDFITFVIKNAVPLKDWTTDKVYSVYMKEYIQREPAQGALERTILEMDNWAKTNQEPITDFFRKVGTIEAVFLIQCGKLSPWVLYLAESADELWDRTNIEQTNMIQSCIDIEWWQKKFIANQDDVRFVRTILDSSGF